MTKLRAGLAALLLALVSAWVVVVPAHADDSAPFTNYDVVVNLTDEGVAEVTIDFTMDFSVVRGRGPEILLPTRQDDGANPDEQFVFMYSNISVSSSTGASAQVHEFSESDMLGLRIGNENRWNDTPQSYTLRYDVTGLIVSDHPVSGMDEFNWDVIGPAWRSRFSDVTVSVTGPAAVSESACFYGPYSNQTPCTTSFSGDTATFAVDELAPREPMQIVTGFPAGTFGGVEQEKELKPTFGNMMQLTPATGGVAAAGALAAIGGLVAIRRRHARDDVYLGLTPGLLPGKGEEGTIGKASGKVPVTVQFHPPKGARPGEIGTLLDTTADDIDVSATMVDLAVRGFMKIESDGGKKFTLHATNAPATETLLSYEEQLLANLFQGAATRTSSELKKAKFADVLPEARGGLYTSVVRRGWFRGNPANAQLGPIFLGGLSLLVAFGIFIVFGGFGWGLISIPFAVFGIGLIALSGKFRKRTAAGSAFLAQAKGFELYLRTAEKETIRFEENQDVFSRYLPYAMVFGVADRWSNLFAQLGQEGVYQADTSWYVGPNLYNGYAFGHAMNSLASSMSSAMQAARADGMSQATGGSSGGSGFSGGGGFGGGGGGSW